MHIENNDDTQDLDIGARLDCKEHVTMNKGDIKRQIDINEMMNKYCENFRELGTYYTYDCQESY